MMYGEQQQQNPPMRQPSASSTMLTPDYSQHHPHPPPHPPPYEAYGDGYGAKRMRKLVQRRAVDYTSTVVRYLQVRMWQRDSSDRIVLQPTPAAVLDMLPTAAYADNPSTSFAAKFVHVELQCNFKDFQRVSVGPWKALFSEKVRQYDESKRVKFLQSRGIHPNAKICGESTSALSSHLSASTSASESCNPPSNSAADRYGASTTVITVDSSTAKIGLSNSRYESPLVEPIKLPESESIKHDNHMEDSSETVGQLDDVDSPCWKGTLAYRRSPFHFNEAVTPHLTSVQSVTEVNPYIPATDGDAKTTFYVENSENLISDETTKVSSIPHSEKSVGVSFSCLQKRSEYPDILESEGNCKGNQCVDIGREQRADLTKGNQIIPEVLWLDQGITGSSFNQPRIADDITMPESGHKDALQNRSSEIQSCDVDVTGHNVTFEYHGAPGHSGQPSSAGEHTQLIDEALQCLRKKLLSHAYKNENALKELLNGILLLVNDYHEASVLKKKKGIANGTYDDPEAEADWTQNGGLKGQGYAVIDQSNNPIQDTLGNEGDSGLTQKNIKTYHDISQQEKMQPIGHCAPHRQGVDFHNFAWEFTRSQIIGSKDAVRQSNFSITHSMKEKSALITGSSMHDKFINFSDPTTTEGMANDFEKIMKKNFCDEEENLLVLFHKNLWIEAQTELLSMKHDLQLARAEIEMLKRSPSAKDFAGRYQEENRNPGLSFWLDSQVSTFFDTGESNRNLIQDMNDDASRMNIPEVLKGSLSIDQLCGQDATLTSAQSCVGTHPCSSVDHGS